MKMIKCTGGCHCGNLGIELELPAPFPSYNPRACDCDFCRAHAAAYLSDPEGKLVLRVRDPHNLSRYRQGSGTAECLICKSCGVLIGVACEIDGELYATVNVRAIRDGDFGAEMVVSPKSLTAEEKIRRWRKVWFGGVRIEGVE